MVAQVRQLRIIVQKQSHTQLFMSYALSMSYHYALSMSYHYALSMSYALQYNTLNKHVSRNPHLGRSGKLEELVKSTQHADIIIKSNALSPGPEYVGDFVPEEQLEVA